MKRVAAIDIGTNSVKMVVGWHDADGTFRRVDQKPIVTRLGQGVNATGRLAPEAMERTLNALAEYARQAREMGVETIGAVGTSALRDALNGAEFVARATQVIGGTVEVISGDREAELVYRSALTDREALAPDADTLVTTDVGGGSTEVVMGQGERIQFRESLQVGAVRLTETMLHSDPPTHQERDAAITFADAALAHIPAPQEPCALFASGGTAAYLGAMELSLTERSEQSMQRIHGLTLTRQQIERRIEHLASLPLAERRTVPGLDPDRADIIIAGAIIQARLLHRLNVERMCISAHGLRYGLLFELLAAC